MADGSMVPRFSLLFSLLAFAGSGVALAASWRVQHRAGGPAPAAGPGVAELEDRMVGLERQLEVLRVGVALRSSAPTRLAPAAGPGAAEVSELGRRVAQLEQKAAEIAAHWHGEGRAPSPLSPEAAAAANRVVLDRHASLEERAASLTLLRPNDGRADGRTHEVVVAALELIQNPETSPHLRAGMIRDLDRLRDPALKDPLVGILSRDPDPRTRREAVETLATFYDDPQVRGLVERLRDADPEPQVRAQAIKQLGRWQTAGRSPP
jgi:hypothetical protein